MITKLMQDIEGDTWDKLSVKESCRCAVCEKRIRGFIHSAQTRLLEGVVKEIEEEKRSGAELIPTPLGFDAWKRDNYFYNQALSDIISKVKQDEK